MPTDWFAVYAPIYDAFVGLAGVAPVAPLLELAALRAHETVLDIGGGTGRVASAAAGLCREVVVLDPCRAMLERMPARANLRAVAGRAQELPFETNRFDVVLCVDALHHIKDASAAATEMHRVLRPGGRILVQEFDVRGLPGRTVQAFEWLFVDRSRFLDPMALEALLQGAGFQGNTRRRSWLEYAFLGQKAAP
jgi:demethylmenaquinone methyltransferase/2-methoxy-6-polyprenyl-1,4-benzoquinol methylase